MFKQYYEGELEFLREMGAEFARAFPGVAAELGMGARDPDIESPAHLDIFPWSTSKATCATWVGAFV